MACAICKSLHSSTLSESDYQKLQFKRCAQIELAPLTGTVHYLLHAASHASVPSLETSKQSTSLTLSYAMFTSYKET